MLFLPRRRQLKPTKETYKKVRGHQGRIVITETGQVPTGETTLHQPGEITQDRIEETTQSPEDGMTETIDPETEIIPVGTTGILAGTIGQETTLQTGMKEAEVGKDKMPKRREQTTAPREHPPEETEATVRKTGKSTELPQKILENRRERCSEKTL
jgi:hypothetical protein